MLYGRSSEQEHLDRLLADARNGRSGSIVVRGEAGIGKTALLDCVAAANDVRVLRSVGIESEAELPFASLHQLLYPFLDRLDALPGPQASALRAAFGLAETPVRDRFLIGAATLSLLSELASDGLLVCLLDDAQWLDRTSSEALLFAARRLYADPIVMVFAVRDGSEPSPFPAAGIEELRLTGLDEDSSSALLRSRAPGIAEPVRNRILAESMGNPLALIELAASLSAPELAWWQPPPLPVGTLPATGRVQDAFRRKIDELPVATQLLLLLAAADDTASLAVVLRAGEQLGVSAADLAPAERVRLIVLSGDALAFRHPLIRAVVYQGAAHGQRIAVHEALASTLTGEHDADRRAWHRATATSGPDEDAAAELDRAADRADQRGGSRAVAAALERAAQLSTDPVRRSQRLVKAARAAYDAGQPDRATELAKQGASRTSEPSIVAEAGWIRAQVEYERTSPAVAAALALEAARPVVHSDPERAVSILTEAIWCARDACAHDLVAQCVDQLEAMPPLSDRQMRPVVDALIGFGRLLEGVPQKAVPPMRALAEAARRGTVDGFVERVIAGFMALLVAEDEAATEMLESLVADLRAQGALGWLPYAHEPLAIAELLRGRFRDAETTATEAVSLAEDIGQDMQVVVLNAILSWLAAVRGDEARCRSLAESVLENRSRHPTNAALADWALGGLALASGNFDAALDRLDEVCSGPAQRDFHIRAIPDHVEAAVRSGRSDRAARYLPALDDWADHTGRSLVAALARRCHALVSTGSDAEEHYAAALQLHEDDDRPYDRARTQLVYGEWLRRQRRRSGAHAQLADAHGAFERLGARSWAERARTELEALGERPVARPHDADLLARLTPQELQVVRLAASGLSNKEIGARLYLSPRTVGHHLYKAYPKIGVTKRIELTQLDL